MNNKENNNRIPELRFPGFTGEWEEKKLGEIGIFVRGLSYNKADVTDDTSKTLVIRSNNIIPDSSVDCQNGLQFVTKNPTNEQILQVNDIVICLANGSSNLVGKVASFDKKYNGIATVGAFCGIFRSISPLSKYLVQTTQYKDEILLKKQGGNGALANLYGKDILEMSFLLPPSLAEQQKIADCLSSLDEEIAAEAQKADALKDHKKGLMQQLFPAMSNEQLAISNCVPKLRFPGFEGEWVVKKLGEVGEFCNCKCKHSELKRETYISTENILQDFLGVKEATKLPQNGSYTKFCIGDILVSNIRPYLKKVWYANFDGAASNDVLVFRTRELYDSQYIAELIKSDAFVNYCMKGAKGVKMPRGDKGLMLEYGIFLPPTLAEQQKIADCLSELDEMISAQQQKVEALKEHKKGLMQKLFPKISN